jgi:hypothetical protein
MKRPGGASGDRFVILDLEPHFNNDGVSWARNLVDGGFNVWGISYPAEALPAAGSVVVWDVPFVFPSKDDGRPNNMAMEGQRLPVPPGRYRWLNLLGASENRCEDLITLVHAGGPEKVFLGLADWWTGGTPYFGERVAFRSETAHYPSHVQERMPLTLWFQRLRLDESRALKAIAWPDNPAMHVFSLTLTRAVAAGRKG